MYEPIKVTKFEVAHRQLRTALELWFQDGDPIAIHALAYASHEIIHRLFRLKGHKDLFFDTSAIKEEARNEWGKALKKSANFIKHAERDQDPNASIEFVPFSNDVFLVMSIEGLRRMGEKPEPIELAFLVWHQIHRPEAFIAPLLKKPIPVDLGAYLVNIKRAKFLEHFLKNWSWAE